MVAKAVKAMMSTVWTWLRPANRTWCCVTAASVVVLVSLSLLAKARPERAAGTVLGMTFGGLALACMAIAAAYGGRKRWRPLVAQRVLGGKRRTLQKKQLREERIREARAAIVDLQAEVSGQALREPREIQRRARRLLRSLRASHLLQVELETEVGGLVRIWLLEKEPRGSLESWLLGHSHLGFLAVVLVGLHSGFNLGGGVSALALILSGIVGLSGLGGTVLYVVIPRALGRIKNPLLPPEISAKIHEVERAMADILKDKSGPFQEMFQASEHELSEEDISKLEDEEKLHFRNMLELQVQKRSLETYLARHLRYQGYLTGWLYFHVSAATFLLTIVVIHVWSILYY